MNKILHPQGSISSTLEGFYVRARQTYLAKGFFFVIAMAQSIIITRILGPEGRGMLAVVSSAQELGCQVGQLGAQDANSYFAATDSSATSKLFANSIVQGLGVGSIAVLMAIVIFHIFPNLSPLQSTIFFVGLTAIPIQMTNGLLYGLLYGRQKTADLNKIMFVRNIASLSLVGMFSLAGFLSPLVVIWVELLAGLLAFLLLVKVFAGMLQSWSRPSLDLFKQTYSYSLRSSVTTLAKIVIEVSDIFMIKHLLGLEAAGFYAVAKRLFALFQLLSTTAASLLLPGISGLTDMRNKWLVTRHISLRFISLLLVPAIIGIFAMEKIVVLLFGTQFLPASSPAVILSFAGVTYGAVILVQSFYGSIGNPGFIAVMWLLISLLKIGLNYVLIGRLGVDGPAVSSIVCYFSLFLIQYFFLGRTLNRT